MKLTKIVAATALTFAGVTHAAAADEVPASVAIWKDMANCMAEAKGKVTSTKEGKIGGKPGVSVKVKLDKDGKQFTSSVQDAKAAHFPKGSAFCAVDFTN